MQLDDAPEILKQAEEAAREEIPADELAHGIFFEFAAWRESQQDVRLSLPEVLDAINRSGSPVQSVFAFLRYHDYARATRSPHVIEFLSRQNDVEEPLYVYWQVTRRGAVYQLSEQPASGGSAVDSVRLTRYVAAAVQFAGSFYKQLQVEKVHLRLRVKAPPGTELRDTATTISGHRPLYDPTWEDTMSLDTLTADPKLLAVRIAADLLIQFGNMSPFTPLLENVVDLEITRARYGRP